MTGGGNVSSSDNLDERQWVRRGELKLFGNVACVGVPLGGTPREGEA